MKSLRASLAPESKGGGDGTRESDGNSDDDTVEELAPSFIAGESMKEIDTPSEAEGLLAAEQCWSQCDESSFSLRALNYAKTGVKEPSPPSLYDLVGIDFLQSEKRIRNIGKKVIFPSQWTDGYEPSGDEDCVPTLFIVNTQFPKDFESSIFTEAPSDGQGWNIVHYFRIKQSVREELKNVNTASRATELFAKYCREAPHEYKNSSSSWYGRFKLITRCENIDEFGLPSFITSYNAKPILIRNTCTMYGGDSADSCPSYAEVDLNVHKFGSLPKKALATMIDQFSSMRVSTGFCIESRSDSEMPETMLGCSTTYKPDYKKARRWEDELPSRNKKE